MKLKSIILTCSLLFFGTNTAFACDEACQRETAETQHSVTFPSYLTWEYCDSLKIDFMTIDVRSLESYSTKHFDTKYKGPIKNTIKFLDQRKEWLQECDNYLSLTHRDRIFYDDATTQVVFNQIDKVKKELTSILGGVTYSSSSGDETKLIVSEKFDTLFRSIDDHKNLMHLKGKYVYK